MSDWSARFVILPDQLPPEQIFWDRPVISSDCAQVQSCLDSPFQLASFLTATAHHSGDWLFALPFASCDFKLDDEADIVAVDLRHELDLCVLAPLPMWLAGRRSLSAALSANRSLVGVPGRSSRPHMLNDLVARAFVAAGVPVAKEPVGLVRQDGWRPDGLTLIPFDGVSSLTWDVTVVCSTADSYIDLAVQGSGFVAKMTEIKRREIIFYK